MVGFRKRIGDTEEVTPLTETQVWGLIGLLGAAVIASPTLIVLFVRSEIGGLRREMVARFEKTDARFDAMDAKFHRKLDTMDARLGARIDTLETKFDALETKFETRFDHLDRDIQALARGVFPES